MKVRASVKRLCGFCKVVKRLGIIFIHCKSNLKHKKRQGFSTIAACLPPTPPPPTCTTASATAFAEGSAMDGGGRHSLSVFFQGARLAFRRDDLGKEIMGIPVPGALALLADPLASLVDTAFIGHIGPVELAAVGVPIASQYSPL